MASILAALAAAPVSAGEPVFDDQAMHPQLLPLGSPESEYALRSKERAEVPKAAADAQQVRAVMANCDRIAPLSQATRERCEIRARQGAATHKVD